MARAPLPSTQAHGDTYVLHVHASADEWVWASAIAIAAELRRDLAQRARSRLLLSGGSTPAPVYRALSKAPLEWDRVDVALVDERWLQPTDPDSNAHLVRTQLLQSHAARARFEAMTQPGRRIEEAVAVANAHARQETCLAVLGMGEDGHVASLFPGMAGLSDALASHSAYVTIDASGCPGAGPWQRRISLTPAGLSRVPQRLLLIRGARKREVFERAVVGGDIAHAPVLAALGGDTRGPLQVHWCA